MSAARYLVGDVFDRLAELEDGSVDLVLTSPPFLALRSYLPPDHPDKGREIGQEPTPAAFLDTLLALTAEWRRVLAPHGSIAVELGDTYSGSGGGGGDYLPGGMREGQQVFAGSAARARHAETCDMGSDCSCDEDLGAVMRASNAAHWRMKNARKDEWPLAKSLTGIPHLYHLSLAYGRNLLTGEPSPAGQWRVRNVVAWCRPNPPVGALCVDDRTEALTPDGWKRHHELSDGDLIAAYDPRSDSCRFLPAKFVKYKRENESMVVIEKRAVSQWLTEDHRVWTRTRKTGPHVRLARDLTNDCETLLCAPFDDVPGPAPVTVERAELLGWYIAEGSPKYRQALIRQSATANAAKVARIRDLLDRDGADYRESIHHRGVVRAPSRRHRPPVDALVTFAVKGELAEWLNLHHKRLPMQYVTTWPEAQARALFDGLIGGDGHRRKSNGVLFHQKDEAIADAVQVLALRLGYRASKSWQPTLGLWQITMSQALVKDRRWTKVRKWDGPGIRRETYTGVVWCPMVETSFWLARRDGKTFITGNSDKFRPATSYMTIATVARDRYFDLDAVRTEHDPNRLDRSDAGCGSAPPTALGSGRGHGGLNPAGAPPLDWWEIPTQPYKGSHYATWPEALLTRPIEAMCPRKVCTECGQPSRRITETTQADTGRSTNGAKPRDRAESFAGTTYAKRTVAQVETLGWTDCGHNAWRNGIVLDPFAGSGTTLAVATGHGRDAIGIDLDSRNVALARERVGMFLDVEHPETVAQP